MKYYYDCSINDGGCQKCIGVIAKSELDAQIKAAKEFGCEPDEVYVVADENINI